MDYIYLVYYQENEYSELCNIRAFQYEESAQEYIDREIELIPTFETRLHIEKIPLHLN